MLGKEKTDKYDASILDLDFKIRDKKFQVFLFCKKDSFRSSIVRLLDY